MKLCRVFLILAVLLLAYCTAVVFILAWPYSLVVIPIAGWLKRRSWWSGAHGSARWADDKDLRRAGMLNPDEGIILGRLESETTFTEGVKGLLNRKLPSAEACERFLRALRRKPTIDTVRLSNAVHTAVFAPTGVGKGISIVIPHLLTCPDATVVVDFKGELAKATAEHRRTKFGHRIVMLDPFKVVTRSPDSFNPLDWIDQHEMTSIDDCRDLAEALVLRTGQERDPHWADSAEVWIAAMTALVVSVGEPGNRSLQTIRALLTNTQQMEIAIKEMCRSEAWDGMLSRLGHQLTHFRDKELGSVLTSTNRFLRFLDTPAVAECTTSSSFDPADLNGGRMTVYLILPPDHMRAQSSLLRMWIGSLMRAVVRGGLRG